MLILTSGIVGADDNNPYSFTGIIPNATLGMYKVFGCTGSVSDDVLIAAFNMAFESGADLITASIGGNLGWVEGEYFHFIITDITYLYQYKTIPS